jgi:hypothetical protein
LASNLNYAAGQTVPNMVVVKVGEGGKVDLFNAAGSADVIVDVAGWYGTEAAAEGSRYSTLNPYRILDTRTGPGPLGPAGTRSVQVTGRGGVPASGVSAVALNVTVTNPTAAGYLTAWPGSGARPLASNLNYVAGQTVANMVVVKVGGAARSTSSTLRAPPTSSSTWPVGTDRTTTPVAVRMHAVVRAPGGRRPHLRGGARGCRGRRRRRW